MAVDLRECKPGDKLRSKHGMILEYVGPEPENAYYDHKVKYPDGSFGTRIHSGHVYRNPERRMDIDHDIVEILK